MKSYSGLDSSNDLAPNNQKPDEYMHQTGTVGGFLFFIGQKRSKNKIYKQE